MKVHETILGTDKLAVHRITSHQGVVLILLYVFTAPQAYRKIWTYSGKNVI